MTNEQRLKNQLEVLHAEHIRKSLLLINTTKRLELSEELNRLNRELIDAQNSLIDELKTHIRAISQAVVIIKTALEKT